MKLQRKIAAVFRAVVARQPRGEKRLPQVPPARRPTPMDDASLPLDPAEGVLVCQESTRDDQARLRLADRCDLRMIVALGDRRR